MSDSFSAWVEALALPRLEQNYTQPDIVNELQAEIPLRLLPSTSRQAIEREVRALAKRKGFRVTGPYVSKTAPVKQLEFFTEEEILDLARKRIDQQEDIGDSLERDLTIWCEAHPESELTPVEIIERARRSA